MKIVIIKEAQYVQTYKPGQIVVNHVKERDWCRAGLAKPMVEFTQPAKTKPPRSVPPASGVKA
jgi:hypothetical protein